MRHLNHKFIDLNSLFTQASYLLKKKGIEISNKEVEDIFRFEFKTIKEQMILKEYINIPSLGSFGIQAWKDILEEERLLYGVKNLKGKKVKDKFYLSPDVINHNWLFYNEGRSKHSTFSDPIKYKEEIFTIFEEFKESVITHDMVKDAFEGNVETKNKIFELLRSTSDISKSWFTSRHDRMRKIEFHNIEGFESYRDRKIKQNRLL